MDGDAPRVMGSPELEDHDTLVIKNVCRAARIRSRDERLGGIASRWVTERVERVKGIEPSSSAWKAVALPLSYTRAREVLHASPPSAKLRRDISRWTGLPATVPQARRLVGEVGLEPTKAKPADLQSAPFAARDTPPNLASARMRGSCGVMGSALGGVNHAPFACAGAEK
jgi:hypothetical protein